MRTLLEILEEDKRGVSDLKVGGRYLCNDLDQAITEIRALRGNARVWRDRRTDPPDKKLGVIIYCRKARDRDSVGLAYATKSGTWNECNGFQVVDFYRWMALPEAE